MVKLLGGQWIDGRWVVKRTNTNFRNNLFDRWLGDVDKIWLDGTYKDNAEVFNKYFLSNYIILHYIILFLIFYQLKRLYYIIDESFRGYVLQER